MIKQALLAFCLHCSLLSMAHAALGSGSGIHGGGIQDGSITTAKLADGSVTTAKIASGAVLGPNLGKLSGDISIDGAFRLLGALGGNVQFQTTNGSTGLRVVGGSNLWETFAVYGFSTSGTKDVFRACQSLAATNCLRVDKDGNVEIDKSLISNKTCATNYTRISPNYCQFHGAPSYITWTLDGGNHTASAPASDATCVDLDVTTWVEAEGSAGYRGVSLQFGNFGAGGQDDDANQTAYEVSGITASTILVKLSKTVRTLTSSGTFAYAGSKSGTNSLNYSYIKGYCD